MRGFGWSRGQKHFPGWWWSATTDRHVGFESWLERDHAMGLDFDREVVAFSSQPFWLYWQVGTRWRRHAPDFFARLVDGGGVVVDVRADDRIPATFLYAGIDVEKAGLFSGVHGSQIAGRFTMIPTSPFPRTAEWTSLIATIESALRLQHHRADSLVGLADYLHQRTAGMIGSLSHLIRGAALDAILTGAEKITKKLLDAVDLDHAAQNHARRPTNTARQP